MFPAWSLASFPSAVALPAKVFDSQLPAWRIVPGAVSYLRFPAVLICYSFLTTSSPSAMLVPPDASRAGS